MEKASGERKVLLENLSLGLRISFWVWGGCSAGQECGDEGKVLEWCGSAPLKACLKKVVRCKGRQGKRLMLDLTHWRKISEQEAQYNSEESGLGSTYVRGHDREIIRPR